MNLPADWESAAVRSLDTRRVEVLVRAWRRMVAVVLLGAAGGSAGAETSDATPGATASASPPADAAAIEVAAEHAGGTLIQLADPLDEPEYYCVDVPGFGARLNLGAALMAHTCKPGADDEMFAVNRPRPGNLSMPAYELCLAADSATGGAHLHLQECSDHALQRFAHHTGGLLVLSGTELCLAVAPEAGRPTGGPSHLRRDLSLQPCSATEPELTSWQFPGPAPE